VLKWLWASPLSAVTSRIIVVAQFVLEIRPSLFSEVARILMERDREDCLPS
jgi:hypothetical protein